MHMSGMFDLMKIPFDTSSLPGWAQAMAPQTWIVLVFGVLLVTAYIIGYFAKRLVRHFARKAYESEEAFVGSSWDLAAPIIQMLVFLAAATAGAELLGFNFGERLVDFWPRALAGIVIIAGAMMLATWLNKSMRAYGQRAHAKNAVDDTLIGFFASIIRYVILGVAILAAMIQLGFAPGSLIAIVGAAGLAIALALQDTLKAVAAGFMIAAFRPFRTGDWVMLGENEGEVDEITPFNTSIKQVDNKVVLMTNDQVWGGPIVNFTRLSRRRLDLYYGVHYVSDLDKV